MAKKRDRWRTFPMESRKEEDFMLVRSGRHVRGLIVSYKIGTIVLKFFKTCVEVVVCLALFHESDVTE